MWPLLFIQGVAVDYRADAYCKIKWSSEAHAGAFVMSLMFDCKVKMGFYSDSKSALSREGKP